MSTTPVVEVRAWNYKTSEAVKKIAREPHDAKREYFAPMRRLIDAGGYMMVTLTNIGKKKISGVSVMAPDNPLGMFWQIDDADEIIELSPRRRSPQGFVMPEVSGRLSGALSSAFAWRVLREQRPSDLVGMPHPWLCRVEDRAPP
jgi:hypothetical protein